MRGDDPDHVVVARGGESVSPACAGMIPKLEYFYEQNYREPRMRGDDPLQGTKKQNYEK